jgi:FMN phosphatase YigB (HAD superfamily)
MTDSTTFKINISGSIIIDKEYYEKRLYPDLIKYISDLKNKEEGDIKVIIANNPECEIQNCK